MLRRTLVLRWVKQIQKRVEICSAQVIAAMESTLPNTLFSNKKEKPNNGARGRGLKNMDVSVRGGLKESVNQSLIFRHKKRLLLA